MLRVAATLLLAAMAGAPAEAMQATVSQAAKQTGAREVAKVRALAKQGDANAQLKPVLEGSGYGVENVTVPIARMLAGKR